MVLPSMTLIRWLEMLPILCGPGALQPCVCARPFDYDADGDVDLSDFSAMQNLWQCWGDVCGDIDWSEP